MAMCRIPNHRSDIVAAVESCASPYPMIVLAHSPETARWIIDHDHLPLLPNLILTAHTHAGQIYSEAFLLYLTNPYFYGLYSELNGAVQIYVSAGIYWWGMPMRMYGINWVDVIVLKTG